MSALEKETSSIEISFAALSECVCVCVCEYVRACVRASVRVCVCAIFPCLYQ